MTGTEPSGERYSSVPGQRTGWAPTVVEQFFSGPRDLDRLSLMSDDVEWWNGLGKVPAAPGQTVFRGKDEIGRILLGRAPSPPAPNGRRIDRYDLATISFADVQTIADGPFVFRQQMFLGLSYLLRVHPARGKTRALRRRPQK